ncbi:hypothetical protein D8M04_03085 [Oceanobacillus piezotolerans]|uniref:Uncharacterized protein n=1 Tax=Oceanobacillus piezotolerans TaxID=2448030 RepID=A0A498DAB4_9BACI|nr:hypothetical protein D8M04_03085 [Oceanobacillus piezotolerans]
MNGKLYENSMLNKDSIIKLFIAVTEFQGPYPTAAIAVTKIQLHVLFVNRLRKSYDMLVREKGEEEEGLPIIAAVLSWGIYGASIE